MFIVDAVKRRIADLALAGTHGERIMWRRRITSNAFFVGLPTGAGVTVTALHLFSKTQPDLFLAITLYPVTSPAAQLAVIAVAVAVLVGFLLWSYRATSGSFFRGTLAGIGLVLNFDIVWVHWIFGLHHITNTQMDLFLEPFFVIVGLIFLWVAITRERRVSRGAE